MRAPNHRAACSFASSVFTFELTISHLPWRLGHISPRVQKRDEAVDSLH